MKVKIEPEGMIELIAEHPLEQKLITELIELGIRKHSMSLVQGRATFKRSMYQTLLIGPDYRDVDHDSKLSQQLVAELQLTSEQPQGEVE